MESMYTMEIVKIGRKWIDIIVTGKNNSYNAQLLIDDTTRGYAVGDTHTVRCRYESKSSGYGRKIFLYAVSDAAIQAAEKAKVEKAREREKSRDKEQRDRKISEFIGYVREAASHGRRYENGIRVLKELGAWAGIEKEILATIAEAEKVKREERMARMDAAQAERAKYTWLNVGSYVSVPGAGKIWLYEGKAYEIIHVIFHEEDDGEYSGSYEEAHYEVQANDITDSDVGRKLLAEQAAKRAAERAERVRIASIMDTTKKQGEPITLDSEGQPVFMPKGEVILNTFDLYGSGEMIIRTETHTWYIVNNGMDGDSWGRNTIRTGGAGAYGWKIENEKVAQFFQVE